MQRRSGRALGPIEQRKRLFTTSAERLLVVRIEYYRFLHAQVEFSHEATALPQLLDGLSMRRRRQKLADFAERWNLPRRHGVSDLEAALDWRIASDDPRLARVDLTRHYAVGRRLHGISATAPVELRHTLRFFYQPSLIERKAALRELDEDWQSFRRRVIQAIRSSEDKARTKDVRPMSPRWKEKELRKRIGWLYAHCFCNKRWKEIADDLDSAETLRRSVSELARLLDVSPLRRLRNPRGCGKEPA